MNFLRKYINIFLALVLLVYYLFQAWLLHRTGFEHSEALFLAEKVKILFESNHNTLLTLGTTFPAVPFLASIIFSPFGNLFAPVIASSVFTVVLFYMLTLDFEKSKLPSTIYLIVLALIFLFHPGILYAAESGRSVAAIIFFFYMVIRSMFMFYKTQMSYFLSTASIFITALIFCDFHFLWLLVSFVPFIMLVALDGLKVPFATPLFKFFNSVNIPSQRRKLANRTLALYIILFLLPLLAAFLFRTLNFYNAGDATYFLTSQYANWHITGDVSIADINDIKGPLSSIDLKTKTEAINLATQTQIIFQFFVLLLTPMLVLTLVMFRGRVYEMLTLLSPFVLLTILLITGQYYITVEYYLMFLVLGLFGVCLYAGKKYDGKVWQLVIVITALLNVVTGVIYFKKTNNPEELAYYKAKTNTNKKVSNDRFLNEESRLATYISTIASEKNRILMDDAAAYKIMAHIRSLQYVIMPINDNFLTVVENPKLQARFICVAKETNKWKNFTVLNDYNLKRLTTKHYLYPVLMYQTENWAVYKVEPARYNEVNNTFIESVGL